LLKSDLYRGERIKLIRSPIRICADVHPTIARPPPEAAWISVVGITPAAKPSAKTTKAAAAKAAESTTTVKPAKAAAAMETAEAPTVAAESASGEGGFR
jgi:hypothetical protein